LNAKNKQKIAWSFIWAGGFITILIPLSIIGYVLFRGLQAITPDFLLTAPQGGLSGEGGISTVVVTTIYLIAVTLVILTPLGIGAAIYLAEYSRDNWITRVIRYAIDTLASVPSIFGLFGFALFVTALHFRFSILSGALSLVCLLLPTLIRTAEQAITTVPSAYREAALALGATKWQVVAHVVLPAAITGIVTGIILCIGRTVEETAVLYVTLGGSAAMPTSLFSGGRTLSLHLFYLAMETRAFEKSMATGAVLIIIIVIINTLTDWLAARYRARMTGGA
jgi:phosphate transport system permease protein